MPHSSPPMNGGQPLYVLVTAAHNEEESIEAAIKSVLGQTMPPLRWVIVSDRSSDRTDSIIKRYAAAHEFITYLRVDSAPRAEDPCASLEKVSRGKVPAVLLAVKALDSVPYDYLGNLDADITLEPTYYENVIERMDGDPEIGIGGGGAYSVTRSGQIIGGFTRPHFVGGPVQFFRRQCWQDIGGYLPCGHEDVIAAAMARMKGWTVRCFPEVRAYHHGQPENTIREKVPICFHMGRMDCAMGGPVVIEIARAVARMAAPPYFIAGAALLAGYLRARIARERLEVPANVIAHMQKEQMYKLRSKALSWRR